MRRLLLLLALVAFCSGQSELGTYNVDVDALSVSGLSSGAAFAIQFQVAYSKEIKGVGILAGMPYYCAMGNQTTALTVCLTSPQDINITALHWYTQKFANSHNIDRVSNMAGTRVFIFSGTKDTLVIPGVGKKVEEYYRFYVTAPGAIATVYDIPAEHGFPTENNGGECGSLNMNIGINNCSYNGAYELLNHTYGGLQKPSVSYAAQGELIPFNQSEFFRLAQPVLYGMDTTGFVYVPQACKNGTQCRLHIAFHGCLQQRERIGDTYARTTGYNEVADLNNLIILYPQTTAIITNPDGCWDWWGFTSSAYAKKNGIQIAGVHRMMSRVMGTY